MAAKPAEHEISFTCTTFTPSVMPELSGSEAAPVYSDLRWPEEKKELNVHFDVKVEFPTFRLKSTRIKQLLTTDKILHWANLWRSHCGNSVPKFVETEDKDNSDIRVLVCTSGQSESKLGRNATSFEKDITMRLNLSKDDDDYRQFVVVHEFGHALGLGHEHQTSHLGNALDRNATIGWLKKISGISQGNAEEKFNADFKPYSEGGPEEVGEFDGGSVMCYPISAKCFMADHGLSKEQFDLITTEDYSNRKLPSKGDILAIHHLYQRSVTTEEVDGSMGDAEDEVDEPCGAYRSGAEAGASGEVTAPTMEEFIARIPPKKRNTPISSEIQIGDIAAVMKDWELISGRLGLSEADVKCIKNDNHHDYMLQKRNALRSWRNRLGSRATYEVLMKVFHSHDDIPMMEKLYEMLFRD